jgi:Tetracyclin repressor-like, C-terminal domain
MTTEEPSRSSFTPTLGRNPAQRHDLMQAIWHRGVARGELRADVDPGAAVDLLVGAALYRLLLGHAPLDDAAADSIVDAAIRGFALGD